MRTRLKIVCWKCGEPLPRTRFPVRRLDECQVCRAPLHVCRMCRHYDTRLINACRHDHADKVVEKENANFCQFFRPRKDANLSPVDQDSEASRVELEGIFGEKDAAPADGRSIAEGKRAQTDASRAALNDLFDTDKRDRSR